MFSGIVEQLGTVVSMEQESGNTHFVISAPMAPELSIDQSVAHNGVCLTVVNSGHKDYRVTAVAETLSKTNLGGLGAGDEVNLERALTLNTRLDGHLVQGHVDLTGVCENIEILEGSRVFSFSYKMNSGNLTVEKGSVCVNGVSLTTFNSRPGFFSVAVIPYTFEHTTFKKLAEGDRVNLEFDIIGKYVRAYLSQTS